MVVTQISVGQNVITNQLAFTQAAAVTDHQPDVRAQHRQVIADGFRIRRANANVNQRNALAVGSDQMPGGHLVLFPRQIGDGLFRCFGFGGDPDPARAGESDVRAVRVEDLATAPADKFVHIAGVVGKQYEWLEMFGWRAGVVAQACQRKIDTAGIKVRQRGKLCRVIDPIRRLIANLRKLCGREMARQSCTHGAIQRQR